MSFLRPKSESCFIDLFSDREKMKTFIYATEKSLRKCTQQQIRNVKFPEQNKKLMNSLFSSSIKWKRFFFLRLKWKRNNKIIERFSDELSIFDQMQKKSGDEWKGSEKQLWNEKRRRKRWDDTQLIIELRETHGFCVSLTLACVFSCRVIDVNSIRCDVRE